VDWLDGYLTGVNTTSTRRNNILGFSDVKAAMSRLDDYCRSSPQVHFAEAVGVFALGAHSAMGARSVEVTSYGSGYKTCAEYLATRDPQNTDQLDRMEFVDWLGGYLSGVNTISLRTTNILGSSELTDALDWAEGYCSAHPAASFGVAAEGLVAAKRQALPTARLTPSTPGKAN